MGKRELWELKSMQAAPLSVKILLTKTRIREWINEFGEDGVYISFSGGKDSTVLLDLVRQDYPSVPAVFCGYGCHLEKPGEGRFEKMKITHPKIYEYVFKPTEQGGLGYKEIIDWINENGNMKNKIRY